MRHSKCVRIISKLHIRYYSGETLNTSGLRLMVVYDNGKTEIVSSGFSSSCSMDGTGEKTVQITYEGKSTSYQIRIIGIELTLSSSSLNLKTGDTYQLSASSSVTGIIKWSSSNSGVAGVSDGVVTANKEGSAVITAAMTYNGTTYRASCNVSVADSIIPSLDITSGSITLYEGETFSIASDVVPAGQKITWSTSSAGCASVSSGGIVTAVSSGSAVITASMSYNGKTFTDTVSVTVISPSISISQDSLNLYPGDSRQLNASVKPDNAKVSWSSSNSLVAYVTDGEVTANSPGRVTITAEIKVGGTSYKSYCTVTVQEPSLKLSSSSLTLFPGESSTLTATAVPSNAQITWGSSNSLIAYVTDGVVTANSEGTAIITAYMTVSGVVYSSTCTVTVSAPSVQISQSSLSLAPGDTGTFYANAVPSTADITWSSSNSICVFVYSDGRYEAVFPGTATITATITVNGVQYKSYCTVTVTESASQ